MPLTVADKIKQKNNGTFALMDADDIGYKDGRITDYMPVCVTEEEYNALKAAGKLNPKTPYFIIEDDST